METKRKPDWLRNKLPAAYDYSYLKDCLGRHKLHTICESGRCPNIGECWAAHTATFMILGDVCTRNCRFCNVTKGMPGAADTDEPGRVALAVQELGIMHCVLTSVTRDDLDDGGAALWAATVEAIRRINPRTTIETLIPDFMGDHNALDAVIRVKPEVISHNLETVERLAPAVRPLADYNRSLQVIRHISASGLRAKSGIMAGLGETDEEIFQTMDDLLEAGCSIITIGQYLQPSKQNAPVARYVPPEAFAVYEQKAMKKGFLFAECQPLVRSSYHAEKHVAPAGQGNGTR